MTPHLHGPVAHEALGFALGGKAHEYGQIDTADLGVKIVDLGLVCQRLFALNRSVPWREPAWAWIPCGYARRAHRTSCARPAAERSRACSERF